MARADDDIPTEAGPVNPWPDTTQMRRGGPPSSFETSRFDPLHEQRQLGLSRLHRQFDLCRPALALRIVLGLQLTVVLAGLPLAQGWLDAGSRSAVLAFATLAATLLWLPLVCALRARLLRLGGAARELCLALLGALAAALGWALVAMVDLSPSTSTGGIIKAVCL